MEDIFVLIFNCAAMVYVYLKFKKAAKRNIELVKIIKDTLGELTEKLQDENSSEEYKKGVFDSLNTLFLKFSEEN